MEVHETDEIESRDFPIVHPPVEVSACPECQKEHKETYFFNPDCESCQGFLSEHASIGEMFSILRQWTPAVQQSVHIIICHMLDAGTHVNDRDGLTDMTMLHYAVKSGAKGIGEVQNTLQALQLLLSRGADSFIRCRWTNMSAIHYAIFFNVHQALKELLKHTMAIDVDSRCCEFDDGTPLHVAVRCHSMESLELLLTHRADPSLRDASNKTPADWLEEQENNDDDDESELKRKKMRQLLDAATIPTPTSPIFAHTPKETTQVCSALKALGIKVGDKVLVSGAEAGILRYCGPTLFSSGWWAGVELDEAMGKNNGSVNNIQYFKCPPKYGIFAPLTRVSKYNLKSFNDATQHTHNDAIEENNTSHNNNNTNNHHDEYDANNITSSESSDYYNKNINNFEANNSNNNNPLNQTYTSYFSRRNLNSNNPFSNNKDTNNNNNDRNNNNFATKNKQFFKNVFNNNDNNTTNNNIVDNNYNNTNHNGLDNNTDATVNTTFTKSSFNNKNYNHSNSFLNSNDFSSNNNLSHKYNEIHNNRNNNNSNNLYASYKNSHSLHNKNHNPFNNYKNNNNLNKTYNNTTTHSPRKAFSKLDLSHITSKVNSGLRQSEMELSRLMEDGEEGSVVEVGEQVVVAGKRVGVVKYAGDTNFAPGLWYGVELSSGVGKNDGSVAGVRYFRCEARHGIFVPPARVQRLSDTDQQFDLHNNNHDDDNNNKPLLRPHHLHNNTTTEDCFMKAAPKPKPFSFTKTTASSCRISSSSSTALSVGSHVFCNGEIGTVHYIGGVDFREGVWVGVELRAPKGRHDGVVRGRRYFTCRPNHGLLVRPSKLFVRGINAAKLITAD